MKKLFALLFTLFTISATSQPIDSAWLLNKYLPAFYIDTGTRLPIAEFVDEQGNKKTLDDFKGKILYVDVWATWCPNCMGEFPYQQQLLKRLKAIQLDTAIQFININIDDTRKEWKKALRKYQPIGINLYSSDTSLYEKWNMAALPAYILLDTSNKVLGKKFSTPQHASIDWLLYCATKGIHPVEALWRQFAQDKLMEKHRSSSAFTDEEYARWFNATLPSLIEFRSWRQKHQ